MNQSPIFLLGAHKSGTSLLRSLLDGHSQLFTIPLESHVFQHNGYWIDYFIRKQMSTCLTEDKIKQNYVDWITYSNSVADQYADSDTRNLWDIQTLKTVINEKDNYNNLKGSLENYFESMYFSLNNKKIPDNIRTVEKSVEHAEFAIDLNNIYPKAKFIHIIRNPYSNFVSIRKFKSRNGYPSLRMIAESLYNNYYFLERNQRIIRENYLTIFYEELVSDTENQVKKIAEFLGVDFEDVLFTPTSFGRKWHGNSTSNSSFSGVSNQHLNNWKYNIEPIEIDVVNRKLHHVIDKFSYEKLENNQNIFFNKAKKEGLKRYIENRLYLSHFYK